MSHFSVLVITESPDEVDGALAPFQENNMGDCPEEYLAFNDLEDEYREEWETGTMKAFVDPDGNAFSKYNERFLTPAVEEGDTIAASKYVCPKGWTEEDVSFKRVYKDFDEFVEKYHGSTPDPETGRHGYWDNPNKKWDWWVIGGRWQGMLRVKPGAEGIQGELGVPALVSGNVRKENVDQCRIGDLDLEAMLEDARQAHAKAWDGCEAHYNKDPVEGLTFGEALARWREVWAEIKGRAEEEGLEVEGLVERTPHAKELRKKVAFLAYWNGIPEDVRTKEEFVERAVALDAFAVLIDGMWHEKGEMGWWGFTSNEKDDKVWRDELAALLHGLDPNDWVTVVDCHI